MAKRTTKTAQKEEAHSVEAQLTAQQETPDNIVPFQPEEDQPDAEQPAPEITPIENAPEGDATPEEVAPIENAPSRTWTWPLATERSQLRLGYTDHEKAEEAETMSEIIKKREQIKREAKNAADSYKARIQELDEELAGIADRITEGGPYRNVECKWEFEVAGLDEDGNLIYQPEKKALIYWPTRTVVRVAQITDDDRQASLNLDAAEAAPETEEIADDAPEFPEEENEDIDLVQPEPGSQDFPDEIEEEGDTAEPATETLEEEG